MNCLLACLPQSAERFSCLHAHSAANRRIKRWDQIWFKWLRPIKIQIQTSLAACQKVGKLSFSRWERASFLFQSLLNQRRCELAAQFSSSGLRPVKLPGLGMARDSVREQQICSRSLTVLLKCSQFRHGSRLKQPASYLGNYPSTLLTLLKQTLLNIIALERVYRCCIISMLYHTMYRIVILPHRMATWRASTALSSVLSKCTILEALD